jgi:hypothetical protein
MALAALTKVGIGKETAWGTGAAPTLWLPVEPPGINVEIGQVLDQGLRGVAARDFAAYPG